MKLAGLPLLANIVTHIKDQPFFKLDILDLMKSISVNEKGKIM